MPVFALAPIAATAFWGAVGTGAAAGAGLYAAHLTSNAQKDAANTTAGAAGHAADLQSQAAAQALAFTKEQAARDQAAAEATRKANYDQWAAKEGRLSSFGQMLGVGPRDIPGYVPIDANAPASAQSSGIPANASNMPSSAEQNVYSSVAAKGAPTASSLDELAAAYKAAGFQVSRPNYNGTPSGNELTINGQKRKFTVGDVGSPNASWYQWGTPDSASPSAARSANPYSLAAMLQQTMQPQAYGSAPVTPALQAPNPYSLAAMLQRR